jgi:REP element-mobilizing transposase RayT
VAKKRARAAKRQPAFAFPNGWGGRRKGAGPKPKNGRAGVSHRARPALAARHPVHVTARVRARLPSLRRGAERAVLEHAFERGADRFGFRLVHYSIQSNHLHLVAEARDRRALARGMQGLLVRVAKALNKLWGRRGSVFADRYHARILRTPREVRCALVYVLQNARHHGIHGHGPDEYSSGPWFDGWTSRIAPPARASPTVAARTWLLRVGWRRHRLIGIDEAPKSQSGKQAQPRCGSGRSGIPQSPYFGRGTTSDQPQLRASCRRYSNHEPILVGEPPNDDECPSERERGTGDSQETEDLDEVAHDLFLPRHSRRIGRSTPRSRAQRIASS